MEQEVTAVSGSSGAGLLWNWVVVLIGQQPTVTILIEQGRCNMRPLCLTWIDLIILGLFVFFVAIKWSVWTLVSETQKNTWPRIIETIFVPITLLWIHITSVFCFFFILCFSFKLHSLSVTFYFQRETTSHSQDSAKSSVSLEHKKSS